MSIEGSELEVAALSALYKIVRFRRIETARQRLLEGLLLQLRRAVAANHGSRRLPAAVRVLRSISETDSGAELGKLRNSKIAGDPCCDGDGLVPPPVMSALEGNRTPPPRNSPMTPLPFDQQQSSKALQADRNSGALSCDSRHMSVTDASLTDVLGALSVVNQSVYGADEMVHVAILSGLQNLIRCMASSNARIVVLTLRVLEGFADADEHVHLNVLQAGVMSAIEALVPNKFSSSTPEKRDPSPPEIAHACAVASQRLLLNLSDDRREALFRQLLDLWTSRCNERSLYHISRCVHELATRSTVEWDYVRSSFGGVLSLLREGGPWGVKAALHMLHCLCSLDASAKHKAVSLGCCARLSAMLGDASIDGETRALCAAGLAALACGRAGAESAAEHAATVVDVLKSAEAGSSLERALVSSLGNMVREWPGVRENGSRKRNRLTLRLTHAVNQYFSRPAHQPAPGNLLRTARQSAACTKWCLLGAHQSLDFGRVCASRNNCRHGAE